MPAGLLGLDEGFADREGAVSDVRLRIRVAVLRGFLRAIADTSEDPVIRETAQKALEQDEEKAAEDVRLEAAMRIGRKP